MEEKKPIITELKRFDLSQCTSDSSLILDVFQTRTKSTNCSTKLIKQGWVRSLATMSCFNMFILKISSATVFTPLIKATLGMPWEDTFSFNHIFMVMLWVDCQVVLRLSWFCTSDLYDYRNDKRYNYNTVALPFPEPNQLHNRSYVQGL